MPYLGREPTYGSFEKQVFATNNSDTSFLLDYPVGSASSVLITKDGLVLTPEVDYTISGGGSTINISGAALASSVKLVAVFLSKQQSVNTVADSSITASKLSTGPRKSVVNSYEIISAGQTLLAGNHYFADGLGATINLVLPVASLGDTVRIAKVGATGTVNIVPNTGQKIEGATVASQTLTSYETNTYVYTNTTYGWVRN